MYAIIHTTYSHNNNMRLRKTLRCVKLLKNFSYLFIRFWAFLPKGNFLLCSLCFGLDYYLNVRINWPDNAAWNCVECCMHHWMGAWREWMNLESGDLPDCKAGKLWEPREETTSRCLWVARFVFLAKLGTSEEVNWGSFYWVGVLYNLEWKQWRVEVVLGLLLLRFGVDTCKC